MLAQFHNTRCVDGRTMRHDPQHDDPGLETDIGRCEECAGKGCIRCDACDAPTAEPENEYGEFICKDCADNRNERAYERLCQDGSGPSLLDQQIIALRYK